MEREYWETRYREGGTSGFGSIGSERTWKWIMIRKAIQKYSAELLQAKKLIGFGRLAGTVVQTVPKIIDVGCGDLSFFDVEMKFRVIPEKYIGIDVADTVIVKNRTRKQKNWSFLTASSHVCITTLRAPIVFCMDLLFHIMDEMEFIETLKNICLYSEDLIFVHTWKYNPFSDRTTDGIYQTYRLLDNYLYIFDDWGFEKMEENINPNRIGCLYTFKKIG